MNHRTEARPTHMLPEVCWDYVHVANREYCAAARRKRWGYNELV